jgi:hypothetical protein
MRKSGRPNTSFAPLGILEIAISVCLARNEPGPLRAKSLHKSRNLPTTSAGSAFEPVPPFWPSRKRLGSGCFLLRHAALQMELPMSKKTQKTPAVAIVSTRTIAAYRAHRKMVEQQTKGATKSVRVALAVKMADYDRLLSTLQAAA